MKTKTVLVFSVLIVVVVFGSFEYGRAKSKKDFVPPRIGIVDTSMIRENTKKRAAFEDMIRAENQRISDELRKISKEVEDLGDDLKTREYGSEDYMSFMQQIMNKQAKLQAQEKFYEQQLLMKTQRWTEDLYRKILIAVEKVAKDNDLDMVFERDQIELPAVNANELILSLKMHKLLYSSKRLDLTDEVLAELDSKKEPGESFGCFVKK